MTATNLKQQVMPQGQLEMTCALCTQINCSIDQVRHRIIQPQVD